MKKKYSIPKAEKMAFDYSESVVASGSNKCGGIYRLFVDNYFGCHEKPTDTWVQPYTSEG